MNENKENPEVKNDGTMDYSFNFSNEVTEPKPLEPQVMPATAEAPTMDVNVTATPETMPIDNQVITPLENSAVNTSLNNEVNTDVNVSNGSADVNTSEGSNISNEADVNSTETASITEDNSENLIKDKRSTSWFLCLLFLLLIAFVIALPFIAKFLK